MTDEDIITKIKQEITKNPNHDKDVYKRVQNDSNMNTNINYKSICLN